LTYDTITNELRNNCKIQCGADDKFGGVRMRQRENRRVYARKFQNEITLAMHAGQERLV